MFSRIRALIVKELLAILRDKKSRFVLIVPPLIQLFVFSFAATQEAKNQTLAVLNLDEGKPALTLEQNFAAAATFSKVLHLRGAAEVKPVIDEQQAIAVLWIPEDFSRNIEHGRPAEVGFILDGRKTNTAGIVQGYAQRIVNNYQASLAAGGQSTGAQLVVRNWFNPNLDFKWYTVPSLVCILTTLISLLVTSLSVAREREMGTFDQLLVSPLHPLEILVGKAVPALIIAMIEGTFMVLAAVFLMRVPLNGSLPLLYASMAVFLLAIIGVGLFISSLSMTQQQAILGAFVFMVPAIILSGFASPIENMPPWLQTITLGNPLRYFMTIVRGIFLKDIGAVLVWRQTWPMAIIAAVTLSTATWLFKKRME
ncbi:MAG: ABC transporter permease [Proteobacteria bacterium]|nr:ABC transporter permease [Pseudomonadota bacterium]MBU4294808.1 ABC transporter permease [Pseudomonadota bacterium]MCG2748086.1 ABC transporter permease [Desulfobulbaceae bacterium]